MATYESGVGEDKGPPRHLEGEAVARAGVLPQGADGDEEEPHCEPPHPEADEDGDDLDDADGVVDVEEVPWEDELGLDTQLDCEAKSVRELEIGILHGRLTDTPGSEAKRSYGDELEKLC